MLIKMILKQQIGDLLEELDELRKNQHTDDFLLIFADVELKLHELRKTLEERKDYNETPETKDDVGGIRHSGNGHPPHSRR